VTGATDGIGREFALQLGKAGFNIVLVSRTQAKLDSVAAEIESNYKVKTKTFSIDFSNPSNGVTYERLAELVNTVDVGVLVNNVGKGHDMPVYFDDITHAEHDDIIEVNIRATIKVTQIVVPQMLARRNGLILNLGSFAGSIPSPMLSTYSGSKAFLAAWSQALAEEYRSRGIMVELLNTYFVVSAMSKIRRPSIMIPTPKSYVKSVLAKIGVPCGSIGVTATSTPFWSHAILAWVIAMIGFPWVPIRYTHSLHRDIRRRALRKKEHVSAVKVL